MTRKNLPRVFGGCLVFGSCLLGSVAGIAQDDGVPTDEAAGVSETDAGFEDGGGDDGGAGNAAEASGATGDSEAGQSLLAAFFSDLNAETLRKKVEALYDPAAVRTDPVDRFAGRDRILSYYEGLFAGMESFEAEVKDEFLSGDETIALWQMRVRHRGLGKEPVVIDGVSHLKTRDGLIVEQRDYFDLGGAVYEHVTLVGSVIRWVKAKLLP